MAKIINRPSECALRTYYSMLHMGDVCHYRDKHNDYIQCNKWAEKFPKKCPLKDVPKKKKAKKHVCIYNLDGTPCILCGKTAAELMNKE